MAFTVNCDGSGSLRSGEETGIVSEMPTIGLNFHGRLDGTQQNRWKKLISWENYQSKKAWKKKATERIMTSQQADRDIISSKVNAQVASYPPGFTLIGQNHRKR